MPKRKPTPLAEHHGSLYIDAFQCGIHPLVVSIDGLTLTYFGDDRKRVYLSIDAAIDWHTRELAASNGRSGSRTALEALQTVKARRSPPTPLGGKAILPFFSR